MTMAPGKGIRVEADAMGQMAKFNNESRGRYRVMRRRSIVARLLTVVALLFGVGATGASAGQLSEQEREDGLWYVFPMYLDEAHEEMGITGEGVTIAVIDRAIDTQAAELQGADIKLKGRWCVEPDTGEEPPVDTTDPALSAHGTGVVSMIVGNGAAGDGGKGTRGMAPGATVWFYGGGIHDHENPQECEAHQPESSDTDLTLELIEKDVIREDLRYAGDYDWEPEVMAALDAIRGGADIVSVSAGTWAYSAWNAVMVEAIREGVIIVGAIRNPEQMSGGGGDTYEMSGTLPASLNGAVAVNAIDHEAEVIHDDRGQSSSLNTGFAAPGVNVLLPGPRVSSGTSYSTPMVAGIIALGMEKNPGASGFQVVQAMIRTTGDVGFADPEWTDSEIGYGVPNPWEMLAVDATTMPDENPLFLTDPADPRCNRWYDEVVETVERCPTWSSYPGPDDVWPDGNPNDEPDPTAQGPGEGPDAPDEGGSTDLQFGLMIAIGLGTVAIGVSLAIIVISIRKGRRDRPESSEEV